MTKKMFQVTRWLAIGMVIFVCINLLMDQKVMMLDGDILARCFMQILVLVVFLYISMLYEKKRKVFSPGYLMILINMFINGTLCPCYFTGSRLDEGTSMGVYQPQDFYDLYLVIYFLTMLCVWVYLQIVKHTTCELDKENFIRYEANDDFAVFIMSIFAVFLNSRLGTSGLVLYVPVLVYFSMRVLLTRGRLNIYTILGLIAGMYCIYEISYSRYMLVEYVVPILLMYFVSVAIADNRKKGKKVIPLLIVGVIVVLAYGMISELIKLNTFWGKDYDLLEELTNFQSIIDATARQIYRLFGIWTELGGNIIHHVNLHGYYHGLTYVKSLAGIFDFEYVSLPLISAKYILASYAQPGLIAEGYANFGIIGAVINLLIPFGIAEGMLSWFLKKRDPLAMCLLTVPFTKILFDGGTINNILFGIATCIFAFALYIVLHLFKIDLRFGGIGDFHLFKKKRIKDETIN